MDNIMMNEGRMKRNFFAKIILFTRVKRSTIVEIICYLFILLFVYAAVSKIIDYKNFRVQIGKSPLLTFFPDLVAIVVPTIELIIALALASVRARLVGLYASFSLMILFTAYIAAITNFSDYIPCSCGGVLQHMTWNQHLIFNIFFVVMGAVGVLLHDTSKLK